MKNKGKDNEILADSDSNIIKRAKKMRIEKTNTSDASVLESGAISAYFNLKGGDQYRNKSLFFYIPYRTSLRIINITSATQNYMLNLEESLMDVFGVKQGLNLLTETLESKGISVEPLPANTYEARIELASKTLEYKKLKRLETFYKLLCEFTLGILHCMHWTDFKKLKMNTKYDISALINIIIPKIVQVKNLFESFIHEEYPTNLISNMAQNI